MRMHVTALMIYTAIFLQHLLAALLSNVMFSVINRRWAFYFFYINHIGNPVIYYALVPKFREGVKENLSKMIACKTAQ